MLGKINLISPPDTLFNFNLGYLLVKPSTKLKIQFQTILSVVDEDTNVYIFDQDDTDIAWLLNVSSNVDTIIIDIDNCDHITKNFISVLLQSSKTFYLTEDEDTPWGILSRNRIYNLDVIVDSIKREQQENDEQENDDQEP